MNVGYIMVAMAATLAPVSAHAEAYDCLLGSAQIITESGGQISGSKISFGEKERDPWRFKLVTTDRSTEIDWPKSPIQLNGTSPHIQTGPDSFASFHIGRGPCMFTEGHCGAIVHYSKQSDGTLSLLVQPVALTRMSGDDRVPFLTHLPAICTVENAR